MSPYSLNKFFRQRTFGPKVFGLKCHVLLRLGVKGGILNQSVHKHPDVVFHLRQGGGKRSINLTYKGHLSYFTEFFSQNLNSPEKASLTLLPCSSFSPLRLVWKQSGLPRSQCVCHPKRKQTNKKKKSYLKTCISQRSSRNVNTLRTFVCIRIETKI